MEVSRIMRNLLKIIALDLTPLPLMAQTSGGGSLFSLLLPFIVFFAIFYFLLILPQSKQEKKRKQMLANLRKGDRVVTVGGIYGTITKIDGDVLSLRIAQNTTIKIERGAVKSVVSSQAQGESK